MDQIHPHAGKTRPGPMQVGEPLIKSLHFVGVGPKAQRIARRGLSIVLKLSGLTDLVT